MINSNSAWMKENLLIHALYLKSLFSNGFALCDRSLGSCAARAIALLSLLLIPENAE